ncbi:MAG: tetratricopeptide repeat protein [Bacteroidota bacterium]
MIRIFFILLLFIAALPVFSQTAEEYYNQADALDYSSKDDAKKAISLLTKAIDARPDYKDALLLRAEIYELQGMYKEEISDFTTLIKTDSTYAGYYKSRAKAYLLKNETEKAISDYTKAHNIDTSMTECIYERGKIYGDFFVSKKAQLAIDDFTFCIAQGSISIKSLSYVGRGRVYENQEDFDKAMTDYNTAVKVNPFCKEAFLYRGILKLSLNQDGCYDLLKYREMYGDNAQDYLDKYCYK